HQPGQPRVLLDRHDDPADRHDRHHHHEVQRHQHQHLHLLDVVGGAGDEGGCAVAAHLLGGEAVHAGVDRAADVPARAHRDPGAEPDRGDRGDDLDHRDTEHEAADTPDVGGVAGGHAVVDDVRVEAGQVEVARMVASWRTITA